MEYRNSEGYIDITASIAIQQMAKTECGIEREYRDTLWLIRKIAGLAGFEIVGRVPLRHKGTGRVFR